VAYSLSVIIPCYNEASRLTDTLTGIRDFMSRSTVFDDGDIEWIFVDDGSSDGTRFLIEQHAADHPDVTYVAFPENRGKGAAIQAGDRIASADIRAFTDCDLAVPLASLEDILRLFTNSRPDLVVASRYTPWSRLANPQPWSRLVAGRLFSFIIAHFHRSAFADTQCGLKAWHAGFSASVVQQQEDPGWSFDLEMICRAESLGATILELPIVWSDRDGSKVRPLADGPRMVRKGVEYYLRYTPRTLLVLGLIVAVVCLFQAADWKNDFLVYYEAWQRTRFLQLADLYTPERTSQGGYYYSPLFAVLGVPVAFVSPIVATVGYVIFQFGLLSASLILLKRWTRYRIGRVSLSVVFWVTFLVLFLNNILGQFLYGNVSLAIFFLCLLSGYTYLFRHKLLSAFWLGLAINIKIFPVFVLGFAILQRDWRFLGYVLVILLVLAVAPSLYFGWDTNWQLHQEFLSVLGEYGAENDYARVEYQSLPSALFRLATHFGRDAELALRVGQLFVGGAAAAVWWTFRRYMQYEWIVVFSFFLAFTAQFVPSSWVAHMGFFYAPLALLTMHGWATHHRWPYSAALVVFLGTYALSTEGILGRELNNILEYWSIPTIGIWVFLVASYLYWRKEALAPAGNTPHPPDLPYLASGA